MNAVEATLQTDTLVGGQLYLPPPSQNPVFLNSHKNSILLHSRKRPAPVRDTFFATWGCPLKRLSLYPNFERLMHNLWANAPWSLMSHGFLET